jgi:DNA sulfur modification protein DndD
MKIASISICNFKSYRDHQKIVFGTDDKYITILEGQMGHGKSNLLNAFYWCLFGQYWDSDKSILIDDPNPNELDLFNKGELLENRQDGNSINLSVEIEFYDDEKSKYTLKRTQSGVYINNSWKFEKDSKISLEKIDANTGERKGFSHDEGIGELQKYFPRSLSNYFLFRGENRTQLVKLQGKQEFQQALRELSKIEMFTRAESHLSSVLDEMRAELAAQASAEIKRQMEEILDKKKSAENSKAEYEVELNKLITIEHQKKDEYEYFRNKIRENKNALELKIKIESEEQQIQELQRQLHTLADTKQKDITKRWAAMAVFSLFQIVKKKYEDAVNSGRYPPDISQSLVDKILNELVCICGTHIKKDSDIFEKIKKLREIGSIDGQLLHEVEKLINEMERALKLINEFPKIIKDIDIDFRQILNEIKSKQVIINGLKGKIGSMAISLEDLQNKQDAANEEYIKTREKITELKGWITTKQKEILAFETEFQQWEAKLDKSNLPAIKVELAEKALIAARDLKRKFENSIYDDLEKFTQENWEILVYDKLYYEKIKLDRDSMYFEVFDKNGQPSRAIINTGHSILLVLSFISALIKIAKDVWKEEFPLVLDAPLSEIGESALPKALMGFGQIFNQTIVILKDSTVNTHIYNQIKNKVGKRYWIEFDSRKQHSKVTSLNS